MRRLLRWWKLPVVACFLALVSNAAPDERQVDERVEALLRQMKLEEKIGQLTQLFFKIVPDPVAPEERIRKGEVGSFLFVTDAAVVNRLQRVAMEESRLHIPLLFGYDVIHGFRTIFPVPLAMAASWDPALVEQVQAAAAKEAYAAGVRWTFAPMVDIARDARWGRMVEGAGEDPVLGAAMAKAQVRGFQGPSIGAADRLLACVKHFAGYGAAEGGRDYDSAYLPEDLLRNVYLPPFHAAVEAGAATVMSAYMDLNDVPATGNRFLLQDVLRREWAFRGFVVSDAFAVSNLVTHGFALDPPDAAFRAFTAGVNMDMGSKTYLGGLAGLVKESRISAAALDDAVRPILAAKMRLGLFEHPYADEARAPQVLNEPAHRNLARIAAQRAAVLLRNEGQVLPLDKNDTKISSIAVIGPLADSQADILGSWSMSGDPKRAVTVLQGLRNNAPARMRIEYAKGVEIKRTIPSFFDALFPAPQTAPWTEAHARQEFSKAVALAKTSDVSVLVLGELQNMSGEAASRVSLDLPGQQEQLLEAVAAAGKPVILVLLNGRPLNLKWASEHIPAILEAWYPGMEGGNAIADVLFGNANPGGKLPITWPRDAGQLPIYYAHNLTHQPETAADFRSRYWDAPSSPLYPFGHGLSYTTFAFSKLRPDGDQIAVDVQNTGRRAGEEVVQFYVHQQWGRASRPVRELKGFQRITLGPGEKRTVRFTFGPAERAYWSSQDRQWVQDDAEFDVWAGGDSTAGLHMMLSIGR